MVILCPNMVITPKWYSQSLQEGHFLIQQKI